MPGKPPNISAPIKPQKNEYDDHFLDVVGNEFKFDHAKGLAEWMKNSADAYSTTAKVKDSEQYIILRFKEGHPKRESIFECIDFVGMTKSDIDKALKVWGLPTAAKKGTTAKTFGGHGNGGKFYMRQMFATSRFITFRGGLLNIFGFDEKRRYGYADGCVDVPMSLQEALQYAGVDYSHVPTDVVSRWKKSPKNAGFTVVRGERPHRFRGRSNIRAILERLRLHPQARRVLRHKQVFADSKEWRGRIEIPEIAPRPRFEKPRTVPLPKKFEWHGETYSFRNKEYPDGRLTLRTSEQPLSRSGELASLNSIDVMGEIGCIGSYRMHELGFLRYAPESEFIYGECDCPFLEDEALDSVRNDREKLVKNDLTDALLEWIRQQVDELAEEMSEQSQKEKKSRDLSESSLFNQLLDKWKNKFMARLTTEIFGGAGMGGTFGGAGGSNGNGTNGAERSGEGKGSGSERNEAKTGEGEMNGGGSGEQARKGPRYPRVLLSSHDKDPLDEEGKVLICDPRHPPVYQRPEDIEHGIYWINTSRPLADMIMDRYGARHPRWREYLFQRYVDIILKQSIHELGRRDPELTSDKVDTLIDNITTRVQDGAAEDLERFLFDENLTGKAADYSELSMDLDEGNEELSSEGDSDSPYGEEPNASDQLEN